MTDKDPEITAVVVRERARLGDFIRRRVLDRSDAQDILDEVFLEFVAAYRLPAPIEQVSAWLYRVARHRIIDRFRKKKEQSLGDAMASVDDDDAQCRLDLQLPASDDGPEAAYTRSLLLAALQQALNELPPSQREVFLAHEFEGRRFRELAAETGVAVNTLLARKRYAVLYLRARLPVLCDEWDI